MSGKLLNTTRFTLSPLGDSAVVVTFGNEIQYDIHQKIKIYKREIKCVDFILFFL